jgi:hypothetical protein
MAAISGISFPGGEKVMTASPAALDEGDGRPCASITLLADAGSSAIYWGYSDMTAVGHRRGFISDTGAVSIPGPVRPDSLFVYGTAGNVLFWSAIPA